MQGERLRMFVSGVLREVCGPETDRDWGTLHTPDETHYLCCATHQILLGESNEGETSGAYGTYEREEKGTKGFGVET